MVVYWALRRRLGKVSRPEKSWKLSAGQLGARTRPFPLHPARFRLHARRFPLPAAAVTVSPGPGSGYPWPGFRFTVPVTPRAVLVTAYILGIPCVNHRICRGPRAVSSVIAVKYTWVTLPQRLLELVLAQDVLEHDHPQKDGCNRNYCEVQSL